MEQPNRNEQEGSKKDNNLIRQIDKLLPLFFLKPVLTMDEACAYCGFEKKYMYRLTSSGIVPHSKPNNKQIFFDRSKLEAWLLRNPKTSLDERLSHAATYVNTKKR